MLLAFLHDPDLIAIGGVGAAFATVVLAVFAGFQMAAARDQVTTMKTSADDQINALKASAQDQITALKETTDKELKLVREQIDASIAQNDAVRDSARAQMQPIVFAHGWGPLMRGDGVNPDVPPGRVRVQYYLRNEGVGPALDVEHGISVGGAEITIDGEGRRYRTLSAGESAPPGYPPGGPDAPLAIDALNAKPDLVYWTRFSNVFGDRFTVLNYPDPSRPAVFRRLTAQNA